MDTATRDRNIATWLGDAPQPVRDTTNQLLERIALLRAEQIIYPAQDDILNALAYTPADQVKVVILGQDPYHGPNQAMGLSFSVPATQATLPPSLRNIYKELNADLGCPIPATGDLTPWHNRRPAPQHHAHRARACRELARQAGLEHAHRLRYRTLLSAAPAGSLFGMGSLCPADGRGQTRRDRRG